MITGRRPYTFTSPHHHADLLRLAAFLGLGSAALTFTVVKVFAGPVAFAAVIGFFAVSLSFWVTKLSDCLAKADQGHPAIRVLHRRSGHARRN